MKLLVVHLSGKGSETQTFQRKLQMLSQIHGEQPPEVDTNNLHNLTQYQDGSRTSWVWEV